MGFVEATKFTLVTNRTTGVTTKRISRDTKWKARYRDPKGRARSKTFDRKYDAEKFLARVDTDIQRDEWVDPQRRRAGFDEWADAWFATTARLSASTRRGYEKTSPRSTGSRSSCSCHRSSSAGSARRRVATPCRCCRSS